MGMKPLITTAPAELIVGLNFPVMCKNAFRLEKGLECNRETLKREVVGELINQTIQFT